MEKHISYVERILYVDIGSANYRGEVIEQFLPPTGDTPFWVIRFKNKQVIYTTGVVTVCFKEK